MSKTITVTGAGLIGRAWAIVFARAGLPVRLHDVDRAALHDALERIAVSLTELREAELITDPAALLNRIEPCESLPEALSGADYVQECGPEDLAIKRTMYTELERDAPHTAILASSTSGLPASHFTDHLDHPERCLVAHPVNPPYLVPLVELIPAPATEPATVERAEALMQEVGQEPIRVHGEIDGFVLNRLQGALLNEALRLYQKGHVSAEDIDKTMREGLGLRWSFMGPLETIDLNAPGGAGDYARRYAPLYAAVDQQRTDAPPWSERTIEALVTDLRNQQPAEALPGRQQWRDRRLMALIAHKRAAAQRHGH